MLSAGQVSGDRSADKMFPLSNTSQWWAMVAASDITQAPPLIDAAIHSLFRVSPINNTDDIVGQCVKDAYVLVRKRYAEDLVLAPIGFTPEYFAAHAKEHRDLKNKLAKVDLGCELLLAGFDFAGDAFILTVEHPGIVRNHNLAGWASIGCGSTIVVNSMLGNSVNWNMDLATVLYRSCEAKFLSEAEDGVGKHTVVKVPGSIGRMNPYQLHPAYIENIRTAWEQSKGDAGVPDKCIEQLRKDMTGRPLG